MRQLSALLIGLVLSSFAFAAEYKQNEVIVKYKDDQRRDALMMENIYSVANVAKVKRFGRKFKNVEHLYLEQGQDVQQVIAELKKNPAVEYAQPNYILSIQPLTKSKKKTEEKSPPVLSKPADVNPPVADPALAKAYGIAKIGAKEAWGSTKGSQNIVVAVIDTGVDYNHVDLRYNMWRNPDAKAKDIVGYNFVHNDPLPFDDHSHGTHCAGVIGAVGGNGIGISGVNQRVSIMALKFLSAEGSGETSDAIRAIDYAIEHKANVLSNSWGGGAEEPGNDVLQEAIVRAEKAGILFVAAAGNDGQNIEESPTYPAAFNLPNMLTVAATGSSDAMAGFSNYGPSTVHLGAPGVNVYSTTPKHTYGKMSGTSMACPHVAGAAALVWSMNPALNAAQVKQMLMDSVDSVDSLSGKTITGGRLNVARAVALAKTGSRAVAAAQ